MLNATMLSVMPQNIYLFIYCTNFYPIKFQLVTGEPGLLLVPAVSPVEEVPKQDHGSATILHLPMEDQTVSDPLLKLLLATHSHVPHR
jgi:hypothetical protein